MSYTWQLPGPPGAGGSTAPSSTPAVTARSRLGGMLDQYIDPITLDYVDTTNGEWYETADSRTIVMIMIETELEQSYTAPGDGTAIAEMFRRGDPVTPSLVASDIRRAMSILAAAGVISDFTIRVEESPGVVLVDAAGRFAPELHYIDLATGSPVDLVLAPFQG